MKILFVTPSKQIWMTNIDWRSLKMCVFSHTYIAIISKSKFQMIHKKSHDRLFIRWTTKCVTIKVQFLILKWTHGEKATIQNKRYAMSLIAIFKNPRNLFTLSLIQQLVIFFWITQDCNSLWIHFPILWEDQNEANKCKVKIKK